MEDKPYDIKKEIEKLTKNNYKKYSVKPDNNSAINSILLTLLKKNNDDRVNKSIIFSYISNYLNRANNTTLTNKDLNIVDEKNTSFNINIITMIRNILFMKLGCKQLSENKIGDKELIILSEMFKSCIKIYTKDKIKEFSTDNCENNIHLIEEKEGVYKPLIYDIIHIFNDKYIKTKKLEGGTITNMLDNGNCGFYAFIDLIKKSKYTTTNPKLIDLTKKIREAKAKKNDKRNMIFYEDEIVNDIRILLSSLYTTERKENILQNNASLVKPIIG